MLVSRQASSEKPLFRCTIPSDCITLSSVTGEFKVIYPPASLCWLHQGPGLYQAQEMMLHKNLGEGCYLSLYHEGGNTLIPGR